MSFAPCLAVACSRFLFVAFMAVDDVAVVVAAVVPVCAVAFVASPADVASGGDEAAATAGNASVIAATAAVSAFVTAGVAFVDLPLKDIGASLDVVVSFDVAAAAVVAAAGILVAATARTLAPVNSRPVGTRLLAARHIRIRPSHVVVAKCAEVSQRQRPTPTRPRVTM